MRTITLYKGILLILFILTFLPLISVGFMSYHRSVSMLEDKITESNIRTLEQVQKRLDSFIQDTDTVSRMISNHNMFQRMLTEIPLNDYDMYKGTREFIKFTRLISESNSNIYKVTLYGKDFRRIDNFGRYLHAGGNLNYNKMLDLLKISSPVIYSPELSEGAKWVIPFARQVVEPRNGETIGILVVESLLSKIWAYLDQVRLNKSGYVIVVDDYGKLIYHPGETAGQYFEPHWHQDDNAREHHFVHDRPDGTKELIISMRSGITGWKLYGVVPYKEIVGQINDLRDMVLLSAVVLVGAVTTVAWLLHIYLVKPIRKLQSLMQQVEQGNLHIQATFQRKDEIGRLGKSFNRMVRQIRQLIEDVKLAKWNESEARYLQKQAQYEALQARIAPHFLYNTLDGISWQARDYGIREIPTVIDDLAGMLRYSLENSSSNSTLEKEFEHARMYGEIIEFRAGGLTAFSFELPDSLRKIPIPRFAIQPLVENSVQHGLEPLIEGGEITVRAYEQDHFVNIEVADTGAGISEEHLKSLREMLQLNPEEVKTGAKGNGLINVHQRIRIAFGDDYGLTISNREPNGFIVRVLLPNKRRTQ